jgi:hypothetical protein
MSLFPYSDVRARSLSRALTPFVSISELDDANEVISRKNYSYRSSTVPPMLYDSSAVSRRYYGDWLAAPLSSYRYPYNHYRSSYYYDNILPYSRYRSDYGMSLLPYSEASNSIARITIRTPPPVNNYLQPIYKTYRHYSSPQYHYHTLPATPIVRHETYAPIYHYHYAPTKTRTTTTTRVYKSLPTYTPIIDTSYYWTSRYLY